MNSPIVLNWNLEWPAILVIPKMGSSCERRIHRFRDLIRPCKRATCGISQNASKHLCFPNRATQKNYFPGAENAADKSSRP